MLSQVILAMLVVVLGVLLYIRQRQLNKVRPLKNLERVLDDLRQNMIASREEGKIQNVASHLSDVLINNLLTDRILFFRNQRRYMEMNFVYGLKNIMRGRFRIRMNGGLIDRLLKGGLLNHPSELSELLGDDLNELLREGNFNIVFPIFWQNNLFGVYFIATRLSLDHPLVQMFLLFLNQNLSIAYHITRMDSARRILENKIENQRRRARTLEDRQKSSEAADPQDYPGYLVEMFSHRRVEELVAGLFEKVRAGLKAEKLVFISRPEKNDEASFRYFWGIGETDFKLEGREWQQIFGSLQKPEVYRLDSLEGALTDERLRDKLKREQLQNLSRFALSDSDQGILFWSGKNTGDVSEAKYLSRLEKIARRAMVNAREFQRVEAMSNTDSLTGLNNHRYFVKRLDEEIQRARRYKRKLGLLLFDLDDFKMYNDSYGHQWGDRLLRQMGRMLLSSLRSMDIVARYGGDEFGIIMPEADKSTCRVSMDRLRDTISSTDFRDTQKQFEGNITISIGSAVFPDDAVEPERLIYCADMALLRSKALGRNRSTAFEIELIEQESGQSS